MGAILGSRRMVRKLRNLVAGPLMKKVLNNVLFIEPHGVQNKRPLEKSFLLLALNYPYVLLYAHSFEAIQYFTIYLPCR